ncbi:SusC/RagA family TonB-linked outer membrane protein [Prolixibacteraceae bacterium JC049]|nr:SusC/RagA family TonB-linked outer membrane protein [Prolixibacteraceae bacterium JC049]
MKEKNEKQLREDFVSCRKLFSIMKITVFLLLISMLHVSAKSFSQSVMTVEYQKVSIDKVFADLEKNSDYSFVYRKSDLDMNKLVSYKAKKEDIFQILTDVLEDQNLAFRVDNRIVIILPKNNSKRAFVGSQQKTIAGKVTDINGDPLPGVSIVIKGTTKGVTTDIDGAFAFKSVPANATLIFSYIGMKKQEVPIDGQSVLNIVMEDDAVGLEEVVAIGYGTKTKATLSGSVTEVKGEVLEAKPITNVASGLQGVTPGLVVTRGDGQPGQEGSGLQLRGLSTWHKGGSSPLVLIDGLEGNLNDLHPNDIQNLIVLKDAAASIYGARASNGVILVTTKTGKKGNLKVRINSYAAVTTPTTLVEQTTVEQMMEMRNEMDRNDGKPVFYTQEYFDAVGTDKVMPHVFGGDFVQTMKGTDWNDLVFGDGFQQSHNVTISGGADKSNFLLSLGYFQQDGIVKAAHDSYEKYNMRLNYNYVISDKLKLETKTSIIRSISDEMHHLYRSLGSVLSGWSAFPNRTADGKKYATFFDNPVQMLNEKGNIKKYNNTVNTNFQLTWKVLPELNWVTRVGLEYKTGDSKEIVKKVALWKYQDSNVSTGYTWGTNPNSLTLGFSKSMYRNATSYFDFNKKLGDHNISAMAGVSHEDFDADNFSAWRRNFGSEKVWALGLGDTEQQFNNQGGYHWAIESLFSRLGYIYKNRYIVEANMRYDGSSRFHEDERWGFFKGFLGTWRASEEDFIKNLGIFDNLKVKLSWGETGNQSGIGLYDYISQIKVGGSYPFGSGTKATSAWQDGMVSQSRTWETVQTQNIGVEATVLDSRLSFSYDYFVKKNKDMLIPVTYPSVLGATPPQSNSGTLKTWGWEAQVDWKDKIGDFKYYVSAYLSDNENELENLGGADAYSEGLVRAREGYPLNSYFGYVWDGIIQNEAELAEYKKIQNVAPDIKVGDARYKDVDGNGKMDAFGDKSKGETGDLVYMGNANPRYSFGLRAGAEYKGLDFAMTWQGVGKRTTFRSGSEVIIPFGQPWRQPLRWHYGKTWTPERPNARYPRITSDNVRYWNYRTSANTRVNARYVRLKNITLGYTLPKALTDKVNIGKLRVYVSGQDIWQTYPQKGTGYDPESGSSYNYYPFSATYSFGIDLTF